MVFDLLRNTPAALRKIDQNQSPVPYSFVYFLAIVLFLLNQIGFTEIDFQDLGFVIPLLLVSAIVSFIMIYSLFPFLLVYTSRLVGGIAKLHQIRRVVILSFIPLIPTWFFEIMNELFSNAFMGSAGLFLLIGGVFQLRILIFGLAHYNIFSFKHAMMVIIILYTSLLILGILIR